MPAAVAAATSGAAPRTVVHLITTLSQGGAERVLSEVVPGPDERGTDGTAERHVVVALAPGGMFADVLTSRGIEVRDLGMRPGRDLVTGTRRLVGELRDLRPVLVVGWMYHACLLASLAAALAGPRGAPDGGARPAVAWMLRGSLHTREGLPWHTRAVIRTLPLLLRGPRRLRPSAVAINSRAGLAHHDRAGYRPRPWRLVVNGVDGTTFRPDPSERRAVRAELGLAEDVIVAVNVARVHPQKDHPGLLAALDRAAVRCRTADGPDLALVLVGTGTEALGGTTPGGVRVIGLGERRDVERLLRGGDVVVSSSLTEGLPNGLLEAMASGLPAVATDVGDCAEVVGDAGAVVPAGDPAALGAAVATLALMPEEERTVLAARARDRATRRFGLPRARLEYRALWDPAAAAAAAMARPLRVVHVIARMNVGGPARILAGLLASADPAELEQWVVTGAVGAGEADWFEVQGGGGDPRVIRVPSFGRALAPLADVRTLRRLERELRRLTPDVVQTHTAKAGLLGRLAARRAGVPHLVHTFHGHTLHGYFSAPVTALFTRVERWLAPRTDRLLAVGARVRDELLAVGIGRPEQYEVLPPGVAEPAALDPGSARRALGLQVEGPVVTFLGRLTTVKRPDRFLTAAHLVAATVPEAVFLVAGDGELAEEMAGLARSGPGRVRFLGWRSDVDAVLAASDVVVLTSDNEGMPLSLIEAAMAGRACVTTDVGGAGEVVIHGRTGLVVPTDAADVAGAVLELLADTDRRLRMGEAARAHARATFGLGALTARVAALHRGVVTGRG